MSEPKFAIDTNVAVYAFQDDPRSERALAALADAPCISIQLLNEFANVTTRKLGWAWPEALAALQALQALVTCVTPMTLDVHLNGRRIAERYRLAVYDALVIAAALEANCATLMSEDMQHGLVIDGKLTIVNPFLAT